MKFWGHRICAVKKGKFWPLEPLLCDITPMVMLLYMARGTLQI